MANAGPVSAPLLPVEANLSEGCRAPRPAPAGPLQVNGASRDLLVREPPAGARGPHDLVIAFHGRTNDSAQVRRYFDLDEALPDALIVYPSGVRAGSGFTWSAAGDAPGQLRDFELVDAIIDRFGATRCIDLDRVFVVGHSLGASFANSVACHLADRIRAVASVAGGIQGATCRGGSAALLIHHPADQLVPVAEGLRVRDAFLSANSLSAAAPRPLQDPALAALNCSAFGEASAHPVVWCPHDDATAPGGRYYPHTWPDLAPAAIAAFFAGLD